VVACPHCGTECAAGQKFCGECGSPLTAVCAACGSPNPPDHKFCGECGAAIGTAPTPAAAPAPTTPTSSGAERRLVSVLFADLVGFTSLSETRDAEEVRELLSRYFDACRRLIELYGGTVEKFIGDAVMAVWGTPVATEDDAERAVRAGLDLVAAVSALGDELGTPDLRARAGVLTGEAAVTLGAVREGMVAGDLVNTASRIQALAEPGSVLVGEATRRASERAIAYVEAGVHELKGKEEPIALWRALRVVSARGGELRSEGLEAPFVGRDSELRRLKQLFHACVEERRAHLVSVTGIAGIGKSRLGWEFYKYFDGIADTVLWHRGRCLAYGEGVTYWALADMVRMRCRIAEDEPRDSATTKLQATLETHLPDPEERRFVEPRLARLLGLGDWDGADRQELHAAWRLFFERLAETNPVLLVFEDLQWADASLLDFVEYLLEWSRDHPIFVVTLARPELQERRPGWGAGRRSFTSLHLEPLGEDSMLALLEGLVPGLPEPVQAQILARAEGVPLYAVETVRMLLDRGLLAADGATYAVAAEIGTLAVPETLHALIAARLDGLSEQERRLLQDGAVLGETFTRQALAALSSLSEPELESLLAGLVRKEVLFLQADPTSPERGQYGFLQDLIRRVAYETLPRRERASRHLAAADQVAAALGADDASELVAAHLLEAYRELPDDQLKTRAADALARAGDWAASLAAAAEAQRYFEQAAELTDDPLGRASLVGRAGRMAWRAGNARDARGLLEQAKAAFAESGDAPATAHVDALLAEVDFEGGQVTQAIGRLEPVLAAFEAAEPDADVAALAAQMGRFLFLGARYDEAMPHLERALAIAERLELHETLVQALNSKASLLMRLGRRHEAELLLRGALETALTHELHDAALRAYNNLLVDLWTADRWPDTLAMSRQALELARRIGDRRWETNFLSGPVYALYMVGLWDKALAQAAEAEERATTEFARSMILGASPVLCERGAVEEARELRRRTAAGARSDNPDHTAWYSTLECAVLRAEGRPQEALEQALQALEIHAETAAGPRNLSLVEALEAAALVGELPLRKQLATLDALPPGELTPLLRAQQARFRARLEPAEAATLLETAERLLDDLGLPFHLAVVRLEHGEHLLAEGRTEAGRRLLAAAREQFVNLRAEPWLERVAALEASAAASGRSAELSRS
jgi:class 3 adenylate cyclase/tetratricopeptide (TPR) repeat protein